ncbi:MAG TPA: L-rhamnose mutarotase [Chitinophagaceae bacterium]|nr:L-rhamnose mutarotase [Chitinophagaceae bacterium]
MKRLPICLFSFLLLVAASSQALDIYVSPYGNDSNEGSVSKPLATLSMALRKAREHRRLHTPDLTEEIHIILKGGLYKLQEPVFIRPEDAGTTISPTIIESATGEQAILSGGLGISNWKKLGIPVQELPAVARDKVWVADLPLVNGRLFDFRQLWVNDRKATRAKSPNGNKMDRILGWNKEDGSCLIPAPPIRQSAQAPGLELFIHQWWAIANLRVKKMETKGDQTRLSFHEPEGRIQKEHPWPAPWISEETGNSAYYLTNAIQFLDEAGEWYLDIAKRKLYYWPRPDENLLTATVFAPYLETLVKMEGTIDKPVSHIYFKGISFRHSGWLRPSQLGHVPHQAGMYMLDAYKLKPAGTIHKSSLDNQAWVGRPAAAVSVSFTDSAGFENCRFQQLASTALDYGKGVHHVIARGNLFKDIGGTAVILGHFADESQEIHLPYNPKDEREISSHIEISNNLISNATNEDWSCVGIAAGYVRQASIVHNELEDLSYSAISLGWGWSPAPNVMRNNLIAANKIHHYGKHNYDCAGIYTLSAQPGTIIRGNYIDSIYKAPYAHLPSHWFYIYTDEGSSFIQVKDNWSPSAKFLQNANGPGNEWINNGPQVEYAVISKAGLQQEYFSLLSEKSATLGALAINREHAELIELVTKPGEKLDLDKLRNILSQNNMDSNAIFQWQDHYVIYDNVQDIAVMQGRLQNNFPQARVKVYHDLFYEFNRSLCADKKQADAWEHFILTANLVENKKLQLEYLDHHASQLEKWPEVSGGFCKAGFQQLQLFRNGRQLMLVISIPKGESLEELNPKTTANNPRMDEWNQLMKKYQQGIEGTKPGETWVFLQKQNSLNNR